MVELKYLLSNKNKKFISVFILYFLDSKHNAKRSQKNKEKQ